MRHKLYTSAIVWAVALLMWTQMSIVPNALAADHFGAVGYGLTHCSPARCYAQVTGIVPAVLDVDDGDDVWIYYNWTLDDQRAPNSPKAQHAFTFSVLYGSGPPMAHTTIIGTYGDEHLSGSYAWEVQNVEEETTIYVYWEAAIDIDAINCHESDYISGGIGLE